MIPLIYPPLNYVTPHCETVWGQRVLLLSCWRSLSHKPSDLVCERTQQWNKVSIMKSTHSSAAEGILIMAYLFDGAHMTWNWSWRMHSSITSHVAFSIWICTSIDKSLYIFNTSLKILTWGLTLSEWSFLSKKTNRSILMYLRRLAFMIASPTLVTVDVATLWTIIEVNAGDAVVAPAVDGDSRTASSAKGILVWSWRKNGRSSL